MAGDRCAACGLPYTWPNIFSHLCDATSPNYVRIMFPSFKQVKLAIALGMEPERIKANGKLEVSEYISTHTHNVADWSRCHEPEAKLLLNYLAKKEGEAQ